MATTSIPMAEFAKRIKSKYPDYASIPDNELVQRIVDKHPEYKESISDLPLVTSTIPARKQEGEYIRRFGTATPDQPSGEGQGQFYKGAKELGSTVLSAVKSIPSMIPKGLELLDPVGSLGEKTGQGLAQGAAQTGKDFGERKYGAGLADAAMLAPAVEGLIKPITSGLEARALAQSKVIPSQSFNAMLKLTPKEGFETGPLLAKYGYDIKAAQAANNIVLDPKLPTEGLLESIRAAKANIKLGTNEAAVKFNDLTKLEKQVADHHEEVMNTIPDTPKDRPLSVYAAAHPALTGVIKGAAKVKDIVSGTPETKFVKYWNRWQPEPFNAPVDVPKTPAWSGITKEPVTQPDNTPIPPPPRPNAAGLTLRKSPAWKDIPENPPEISPDQSPIPPSPDYVAAKTPKPGPSPITTKPPVVQTKNLNLSDVLDDKYAQEMFGKPVHKLSVDQMRQLWEKKIKDTLPPK